jgi:hypothetical protein
MNFVFDANNKRTDRSPSKQRFPARDCAALFEVAVALLDGTLNGLRRSEATGYMLSVLAAPFSELPRLKSILPDAAAYICYVIHGEVVYVGHGNGDRKIGERLAAEVTRGAQVYVIFSLDPRFDKLKAGYVEARLIDRLYTAGIPLANMHRPYGGGLNEHPGFEQLVRQSEVLLGVAGFRPLESPGAAQPPMTLPAARTLRDVVPIDPDKMPTPEAGMYRLNCGGMRAEGFFSGKKTFYIRPGADYELEARPGTTKHNLARRNDIERFLEPTPGVRSRKQLHMGLKCVSAAIAAKVLTGKHLGTNAWQPFP